MALLADLVLVAHAVVILFVVGGQLLVLAGAVLHWHWVRNLAFRAVHLLVILFVVAQTWLDGVCPLTSWEWQLRRAAGQPVEGDSFIGHWLHRLIFYQAPDWVFALAYTAFAVIVAASWRWIPPRRGR